MSQENILTFANKNCKIPPVTRRNMKLIINSLQACIAIFLIGYFTQACLLTNSSTPPPDSVSGKDLADEVQVAVWVGLALARAPNDEISAFMNRISEGILFTNLKIKEKAYYTRSSADRCLDIVRTTFMSGFLGALSAPYIASPVLSGLMCDLEETGDTIHLSDGLSL